jgi:hypothetical protein
MRIHNGTTTCPVCKQAWDAHLWWVTLPICPMRLERNV